MVTERRHVSGSVTLGGVNHGRADLSDGYPGFRPLSWRSGRGALRNAVPGDKWVFPSTLNCLRRLLSRYLVLNYIVPTEAVIATENNVKYLGQIKEIVRRITPFSGSPTGDCGLLPLYGRLHPPARPCRCLQGCHTSLIVRSPETLPHPALEKSMKRVHRIAHCRAGISRLDRDDGCLAAAASQTEDILGDAGVSISASSTANHPARQRCDRLSSDSQFDISPGDVVNQTATGLLPLAWNVCRQVIAVGHGCIFSGTRVAAVTSHPLGHGHCVSVQRGHVLGPAGLVSFRDDPDAEPGLAPDRWDGDLSGLFTKARSASIDALYHAAIDQQQRIAELVAAVGAPTLEPACR